MHATRLTDQDSELLAPNIEDVTRPDGQFICADILQGSSYQKSCVRIDDIVSAIDPEVLDIGVIADPICPEDVRREFDCRKLSRVGTTTPRHRTKNGMAWALDVLGNETSIMVDSELVDAGCGLSCLVSILSRCRLLYLPVHIDLTYCILLTVGFVLLVLDRNRLAPFVIRVCNPVFVIMLN